VSFDDCCVFCNLDPNCGGVVCLFVDGVEWMMEVDAVVCVHVCDVGKSSMLWIGTIFVAKTGLR
jgi:hypothetical protein